MDESSINLHYAMLEYIFTEQQLPESFKNHVWEGFRDSQEECQEMTAGKNSRKFLALFLTEFLLLDDLKLIFWRDVMPNIRDYQVLDDDMRDYFTTTFLEFSEENIRTIQANEPKVGKDFVVIRPDESPMDVDDFQLDKPTEPPEIATKIYNRSFGFDSDSEPDDNCLAIKLGEQAPLDYTERMDDSMYKVFNAVLRPKRGQGDSIAVELKASEILERLTDMSVLTKAEAFESLPGGVGKYASQFEFFKKRFQKPNAAADGEKDSLPFEEATPLGDISNQRVLRSSAVPNTPKALASAPATRQARANEGSRHTSNVRMESWGKQFVASKRRRESTSPQGTQTKN